MFGILKVLNKKEKAKKFFLTEGPQMNTTIDGDHAKLEFK